MKNCTCTATQGHGFIIHMERGACKGMKVGRSVSSILITSTYQFMAGLLCVFPLQTSSCYVGDVESKQYYKH